jgi:hypothetical protein
VPANHHGPLEDLHNGLELHPSWTWDSLDPIIGSRCDAQVSQQSLKSASGDRSFSPEGLNILDIPVQLLALCVAQGRVLLIVFIFVVDVVVLLLLLLLLSRCALGYWAPRNHQLDLKRLLLLRCILWWVELWLLWRWHIPRCQLTSGLTIGALTRSVARTNHLSFRKRL